MRGFKISPNVLKKDGHLKVCYGIVMREIEQRIPARGAIEIRDVNKWDASNSGSRLTWKALDRLKAYRDFLFGFGVEFEELNDSPKRGFIHDYLRIDTKNRRQLRAALKKAASMIAPEDWEKINKKFL